MPQRIEHLLDRTMYASRWIMAPVYLGMSLVLLALAIKFFQALYHFLPEILGLPDSEIFLKLLTFVDLPLVGSLISAFFMGYPDKITKH